MTFVEAYLEADEKKKANMLSTWLHKIKYSDDEKSCFDYFNDLRFSLVTESNKIEVAKLCVFIENALASKWQKLPVWSGDCRLVLETPYRGPGYNMFWFFFGNQSCLRYNCFIDSGSLEVV